MSGSGRISNSLHYFEFIPYIKDNQYYIEDNDIDAIDIHDYAKGCYNLKEEIIKHYPGLYNMTYELLVEYYLGHVERYGETDDPLHLAHLIAEENNAHFVDSDYESIDDAASDIDTDPSSSSIATTRGADDVRSEGDISPERGSQGVIESYFPVFVGNGKHKPLYICGVCKEEVSNIECLSLLNCCSHQFCYKCITNWCQIKPSCPVCRLAVTRIDKLHIVRRSTGSM